MIGQPTRHDCLQFRALEHWVISIIKCPCFTQPADSFQPRLPSPNLNTMTLVLVMVLALFFWKNLSGGFFHKPHVRILAV